MKKNYFLFTVFFMSFFGLIGCQTRMINVDYDSSKKIQIVPVTESTNIMIQDNRVIKTESLFDGMKKENPEIAKPAEEAESYYNISKISLNIQAATLFGCAITFSSPYSIPLCLTSIGFGLFGTIPYSKKTEAKALEAAQKHNQFLEPIKQENTDLK